MLTPFDEKSPLAHTLDRIALRILLLFFSLVVGLFLFDRPLPALLGGGALYITLLLMLLGWERMHLQKKEAALRRRIGGALGMEALSLMTQPQADAACAQLLCQIVALESLSPPDGSGVLGRLGQESVLIRCDLKAPDETSGTGSVLAAMRAQKLLGANRVLLCTTTHFSDRAAQLAELADPPVRLVDSAVLAGVYGRLHPATDEQLSALGKRKRSPFSWPRLKMHAFSPGKKRRYLTCAFVLLVLFLLTDRLYYLLPSLLCYLLALGAHRSAQSAFRL